MTRALLSVAVAAACFASGPRTAQAQSCDASLGGSCAVAGLNISISFSRAFELTLSSGTTALTVPTPAHYNAGFAATTGPTITIRSNTAWTLAIGAATSTWSALNTQTEPARANKPAADLRWALAAGGPFTGFTTAPVTIRSGAATTGTNIQLFYRTLYAWQLDTPGTYSLQVVVTLTAP